MGCLGLSSINTLPTGNKKLTYQDRYNTHDTVTKKYNNREV